MFSRLYQSLKNPANQKSISPAVCWIANNSLMPHSAAHKQFFQSRLFIILVNLDMQEKSNLELLSTRKNEFSEKKVSNGHGFCKLSFQFSFLAFWKVWSKFGAPHCSCGDGGLKPPVLGMSDKRAFPFSQQWTVGTMKQQNVFLNKCLIISLCNF